MKKLCLDFEYSRPANQDMGLISCALFAGDIGTVTYWLRDPKQMQDLKDLLLNIRSTHTLVGYECQLAEARCLAAMGLTPTDWQWRDLLAEWRWLRNETNEYKYGRVVKNGLAYYTVPPKRRTQKRMTQEEVTEVQEVNAAHLAIIKDDLDEENVAMEEAGFHLLDCCYFFECMTLEQYRQAAATKAAIRDGIIIGSDDARIQLHKEAILEYNRGDIHDMVALADKLTIEMEKVLELPHITVIDGNVLYADGSHSVQDIQLSLGKWCAQLATYANRGIQLDPGRMDIFLDIAPKLTMEIKEAWNRDHPLDPLYRVGMGENVLEKRKEPLKLSPYVHGAYTQDAMALQWIVDRHCLHNSINNWPKTRQGQYMTDKKTLGTFAVGESIIKLLERHRGQLSNLKAFTPNKDNEIEAFRYIGSDCKQRPDFGAHGTQTDRNAHKAKSLLFANAHWMRILMNPAPGMAFVECDYSAEEIFISAALSGDENLKAAYASNDVYMYYAQLTGIYPADLPIPTEAQRSEEWFKPYKRIRQIAKTLVLATSYGAGAKSIALAIAMTTGEPVDVEAAMELIAGYRAAYPEYTRMVAEIRERYQAGNGIMLANGWRLGPDSPSVLSASNLPIQGTGSVILQRACHMLDHSVEIVATMHDSVIAYVPESSTEKVAELMQLRMKMAASDILGCEGMKVGEPEIVRHGDWWLHGDKGVRDWPKYKKYFGQ